MKKVLLAALLSLSVCMATGCGMMKAEKTEDGTVKVEEATEQEAEPTPEPTQAPTPEPTEEPTPEPTLEPEPPTWLEEQGITITPQGDFTYQTMGSDGTNDLGEFDVSSNVSISETTEGAEEGFKKVIAVFQEDYSQRTGGKYLCWHSAFDRYTGIAFEISNDTIYDNGSRAGVIPIEYDGKTYETSIEYDWTTDGNKATMTVTVTCPEDYDGTVFQAGYSDSGTDGICEEIDLAERLHTLDEFPNYDTNGHTYYYFTINNQ